jgi:hypothetical protein
MRLLGACEGRAAELGRGAGVTCEIRRGAGPAAWPHVQGQPSVPVQSGHLKGAAGHAWSPRGSPTASTAAQRAQRTLAFRRSEANRSLSSGAGGGSSPDSPPFHSSRHLPACKSPGQGAAGTPVMDGCGGRCALDASSPSMLCVPSPESHHEWYLVGYFTAQISNYPSSSTAKQQQAPAPRRHPTLGQQACCTNFTAQISNYPKQQHRQAAAGASPSPAPNTGPAGLLH